MRKRLAIFASGISVAALMAAAPAQAQPFSQTARWSSLYFGGHAGYSWNNAGVTLLQNGFAPEAVSHDFSSFLGGGQIGLQQQFGTWVFGAEVSLSGGPNLESRRFSTVVADRTRSLDLSWLTLATLKLGYTFGPGLLYVKGGYAIADIGVVNSVTSTGTTTGASSRYSDGWTLGVGYDYALTQNWSLGLQYDYVSLAGGNRFAPSLGFGAGNHLVNDADMHLLTARLNFRFNFGQ